MNIFKKSAYFTLGVVLFACNDPNVIGLDLPGDKFKLIIKIL